MKHSELKKGDIIIFKIYDNIKEKDDYQDGTIINVIPENKELDICWLDGYHSRVDTIKYDKAIAKHDANGICMKFGSLRGNSVLLENES